MKTIFVTRFWDTLGIRKFDNAEGPDKDGIMRVSDTVSTECLYRSQWFLDFKSAKADVEKRRMIKIVKLLGEADRLKNLTFNL